MEMIMIDNYMEMIMTDKKLQVKELMEGGLHE